ncbi:hypothetical protein JVU11DRAFT_11843 [Chiua virens]|nr:hypothetical protein JVU11DRAFT_11843 [Chiua virens]
MPVSPELAPRRYADLCNVNFSRWGVWDPAQAPKVGSYGLINAQTGSLDVEGNVYDPEFQKLVDEGHGIKIADYPLEYTNTEIKPILNSMWVRKKEEFKVPSDTPEGVDSASTKGQWWFQKGHSCSLVFMHEPREQVLPGPVLEELYKIPLLKHKHLITKAVHCSAYARYLSGTNSEHITLSLIGSEKTTSGASSETRSELKWWTQGCEPGYLKTDVNQNGELCFAPVFTLRQKLPLIRALLRDVLPADPKPESYWCMTFPPWYPLDDDGVELDEGPEEPVPTTTPAAP